MVNLIALAIPFFFLGIGLEVWVAKRRGVNVYRFSDAFADMGCGVLQQITTLLYVGVLLAAYAWVYAHARLFTLPGWLAWPLAFVGVDFVYYWWHRLSHEVNFLWAAHVVHHQSEDYNLAVALRQSITTTVTFFPFLASLALLGIPPLQSAVANSLLTLYQFWIHTELVGRLPRFERWFNSPSLHRVHHAINPQYLDRNHGATSMVWDRLFGTYQPEQEPCVFGITVPLGSFNPVWAQVDHFSRLARLTAAAPGVVEKLKVWFASPAWKPAWLEASAPGAPVSRERQQKYDPIAAPRARRWAFWQFVLLVVCTFLFLMFGPPYLSVPQQAMVAGLLYLSLIAIAGLLENRPHAMRLEVGRWVTVAAMVPVIVRWA